MTVYEWHHLNFASIWLVNVFIMDLVSENNRSFPHRLFFRREIDQPHDVATKPLIHVGQSVSVQVNIPGHEECIFAIHFFEKY